MLGAGCAKLGSRMLAQMAARRGNPMCWVFPKDTPPFVAGAGPPDVADNKGNK